MKKILLIENDADCREIVRYILTQAGHEVTCSDSSLVSHPSNFDLVILDEFLKNQRGSTLCKAIKSNSISAHTPVLLFSATNNLKSLAKDCCADAYLEKPFDVEEFERLVMQLSEIKSKQTPAKNAFGVPIIPSNDYLRVKNLQKYRIMNSSPESEYAEIATTVATSLQVPLALINFIDKENVWTKSDQEGNSGTLVERNLSFCSLAILKDQVIEFEDVLKVNCLMGHPFVAGAFGLRFYAAAPIISPDGYSIGAVCAIDKQPRRLTPEQKSVLEHAALKVRFLLERRLEPTV